LRGCGKRQLKAPAGVCRRAGPTGSSARPCGVRCKLRRCSPPTRSMALCGLRVMLTQSIGRRPVANPVRRRTAFTRTRPAWGA
jgi:hypothetical protein